MRGIFMNGAFYIARKSFESELWRNKPASWWKIWCYILGSVQHTEYKELKRGQGYFNFTELCRMGIFGKDVTINNIEKFIKFAKRAEMIATAKATQGVLLLVRNYDLYQDIVTYKSDSKSGESGGIKAEQKRNRSGDINNNDNNVKNDNTEKAINFINQWNEILKNKYKSSEPIVSNLSYWLQTYSMDEIKTAISKISSHPFWKDKMTPTMLLRRKNPRGEAVDYIGELLNLKQSKEKDTRNMSERMIAAMEENNLTQI